ncbi:Uncharacterized protein APZ42_020863 [Daphnia magna]|uniref:Uncharacterized protein n=1 Tax=Daphnia magna TaxID=35525 RepID=A0A164XFK6_9CRUS|nr:Uncharacterized protein APZ42_020863 [Daphnia magna]
MNPLVTHLVSHLLLAVSSFRVTNAIDRDDERTPTDRFVSFLSLFLYTYYSNKSI